MTWENKLENAMSFKVISVAEIPSLFKRQIEAKWKLLLGCRWVCPKAFSCRLNEIHLLLQFYLTINIGIRKAVPAQGECKQIEQTCLQYRQQLNVTIRRCHLSECDANNICLTASKPHVVKCWSEMKLEAPYVLSSTLCLPGKVFFFCFSIIIPENFHMASDCMEALLKLS